SLQLVAARNFVDQYWPVVIIALGLARLLQARSSTGRAGGIIWVSLGLVILMHTLGFIHLRWRILWPLGLVLLGCWIVWRAFSGARSYRTLGSRGGLRADVG